MPSIKFEADSLISFACILAEIVMETLNLVMENHGKVKVLEIL